VHTSYTDGSNTVNEYCRKAVDSGLALIAFTEHIRKEPDYDFAEFIAEVNRAKDEFDMVILGGAETKVLDTKGTLDISEEHLGICEIVLASFHGTVFETKDDYIESVLNMLKNPEVDVWAHPTLYPQRAGFELEQEILEEIAKACSDNDVLIEKNSKYDMPSEEFLKVAEEAGCRFVEGSDAHTIDEIRLGR
jgi:histidinol phosphatase-like PHP family hydrolase